MLARQRQTLILDRVREAGAVRVADLARELDVSDMTVRRDLEVLHERRLLEKVHGGATALSSLAQFEPGFVAKSSLQQAEKELIAETAVGLVEPGMAIAISAGTTTFAMAARIAEIPRLTIVTNSMRVADVLFRTGRHDQTVILTGGTRTPSEALVGPFTIAQLRSIHVDLVFMGIHGMDAKAGFTCPNIAEAETNVTLREAGRRLVVVADSTKWGVVGIATIARLDEADILVTDSSLEGAAVPILEEAVGRLVLVSAPAVAGDAAQPPHAGLGRPVAADPDGLAHAH
ncbi:MAG: DeoR/GlpR family DNA-binding transcription regulator [Chloroflexota bacterium]